MIRQNATWCLPQAAKRIRASVVAIPKECRKRWVIKTGYRVAKKASGRTTSLNPSARVILFYMALLNADL